ncbi:MAG TPA: hypothetical protein VF719_09395 [Abditibacteriaceae bacterium]|jgi:DNA-binding beta-propeller fold protein YncE
MFLPNHSRRQQGRTNRQQRRSKCAPLNATTRRYAPAIASLSTVALGLTLSGCGGGSGGGVGDAPASFSPAATYRVSGAGAVAEIVAASPDGRTLVYTDSETPELGFVDITNASAPVELGKLALNGEPTSVSFTPDGKFALAVVNDAPGKLLIINMTTRAVLRTINLNGQPDCISVSPDGRYAAIAIENERADEDAPLPQAPAGFMVILDMVGEPEAWTTRNVSFAGRTGLRFASDPEPEFIDINAQNRAAVTLQENNAIAIVNLATGAVERTFSAGTVTHAADTKDDGKVAFTDQIVNSRREPDAIAWTPGGNLITANEGDYDADLNDGQFTGGRGFTVFSPTGTVLFDSGVSLEQEVAKAGFYNDSRSDNKGTEPEGVEIGRYNGRTFAFIGLERGNCVAVYRLDNESSPQFVQILPTGQSPEGLLAIPSRNLFVTANEGNGTISIFK